MLIIGGLVALAAYLLFRKGGPVDSGGGGGGGYDTGYYPEPYISGSPVNYYYYHAGGGSSGQVVQTTDVREVQAAAGSRQSWSGATYGQPGQPSVKFLANTLREASAPGAPEPVKMAAAAARAGAPPRIVAKIKAGKVF